MQIVFEKSPILLQPQFQLPPKINQTILRNQYFNFLFLLTTVIFFWTLVNSLNLYKNKNNLKASLQLKWTLKSRQKFGRFYTFWKMNLNLNLFEYTLYSYIWRFQSSWASFYLSTFILHQFIFSPSLCVYVSKHRFRLHIQLMTLTNRYRCEI